MRITGGNFGVGGKAKVDAEKGLVLSGVVSKDFAAAEIARVTASEKNVRQFSPMWFLIAGAFCTVTGWIFFGLIGAALGLILAVATSFGSTTTLHAVVDLKDGSCVELQGWHYEIQKLVKLANTAS